MGEQAAALFQGQRLEFAAAHRDGRRREAEMLIGFAVPIDWADLEAAAWVILSAGGEWDEVTADWVVSVLLYEGMEKVTEARHALATLPAAPVERGDRARLREHVTSLFGPRHAPDAEPLPSPLAAVVPLTRAGGR